MHIVEKQENPYKPALGWIRTNSTTGSAIGLVKLILSLWNDDAAFSFRECVRSFDDIRSAWALKIIAHFLKHGEDRFLRDAGKEVYELYPYIWDEGYAGSEALKMVRRSSDFEEAARRTLKIEELQPESRQYHQGTGGVRIGAP